MGIERDPSKTHIGWGAEIRLCPCRVLRQQAVQKSSSKRVPPPLLCADSRTCPNPRDRGCNGRFLGIFARPQDAEDASDADSPLFRRFLSGLASVNQSEALCSLGASRGDAAAIFAFRLGLGDAFQLPRQHYA